MKKSLLLSGAKLFVFSLLFCGFACQKNLPDNSTLSTPATKTTLAQAVPMLSSTGIGGYDLNRYYDKIMAYDYGHSGRADYLVCYRLVEGNFWILNHTLFPTQPDPFIPIYKSDGIAGYNLLRYWDRIVTFDYDHSGKEDYLVAYRPSDGQNHDDAVYIIKNNSSLSNPSPSFTSIIHDHDFFAGISLEIITLQVAAFDYDHSGKMDYLILARPGDVDQLSSGRAGSVYILKNNNNGTFSPVFTSHSGLDIDLFAHSMYATTTDYTENDKEHIVAFDYEHSGKRDYILHIASSYGDGPFGSSFNTDLYIDRNNNNGTFTTVLTKNMQGSATDASMVGSVTQCIPFDYEHSGKADYLLMVNANAASPQIFIYKNNNDGTLTAVFTSVNHEGIGGWQFNNQNDKVIAYDFDHTGKQDYLLIYRPGNRLCTILKNTGGVFSQVY